MTLLYRQNMTHLNSFKTYQMIQGYDELNKKKIVGRLILGIHKATV